MSSRFDELRIFTGNANPGLTQSICQRLGIPIGDMIVTSFSNENIFVKINESVREKDVFVHYTDIQGDGFRTLDEGARVEFEIEPGKNGDRAKAVSKVEI